MEYADKRFTEAQEALLRRAKGAQLMTVNTVIVSPPYNSWNTVRLHFAGFSLDVNNCLQDIVINEFGSIEEFGLFSIKEAPSALLDIPEVGADTTTADIDKTVNAVTVINDVIDVYRDGVQVARHEYPQAIVLAFQHGYLSLDKGVWFTEMIAVKQGDNIDNLISNQAVNWEDDPDDPSTHFEFHTETYEL